MGDIVTSYAAGKHVILKWTSANSGWTINTSTINAAGEVITSLRVSEAMWSTEPADALWTVTRGANTVLELGTSGTADFQRDGITCENTAEAANNLITATLTGTGQVKGTLILKCQIRSNKSA